MAKTETNVSTLKINRGTYAKVQENLSSITENELIITSDKNVPIPTTNDNGKAVVVNASGEYELGNIATEVHTYTSNKTYTSSDTDYEQLLDDVTNKRVIQIESSILSCQDVTTSTSTLFTYITAGISSTATVLTRYLITYDSTNNTIEIASPTTIRNDKVVANPILAGTESNLTGLQVGNTKYAVGGSPALNSYTIKTYTSSDTNYQQLRDDLTNKLPIIVTISSQPYEFYHSYTYEDSGTTYITYVNVQNMGANTTLVTNKLAITMTSSNVVIPSATSCSTKYVAANQGSATDTLTDVNIGGTVYAMPTGYKVNTYTPKTYTTSDTDYLQLKHDINNKLPIFLNGVGIFYCINHVSTIYRYERSIYNSNTMVAIESVTITENSNNIVVGSYSQASLYGVTGNTSGIPQSSWTSININSTNRGFVAKETYYLTTAPVADNTSGYLQLVVLTQEPATYYNGYDYKIVEAVV